MSTQQATLPERVLGVLSGQGPSFARELAGTLGASEAAVTGALSSLRRRELVERAERRGLRVYYRAAEGVQAGEVLRRRARQGETLQDRVLRGLGAQGPSFARRLAAELDAPEAAVTGALSTLRRRGLVERLGRHGSRVYYRASGDDREVHDVSAIVDRVAELLRVDGPNFPSRLAGEIQASEGSVSRALSTMQRTGRVECLGRDGRHVYYRVPGDDRSIEDVVDEHDDAHLVREHPEGEPDAHLDGEHLVREPDARLEGEHLEDQPDAHLEDQPDAHLEDQPDAHLEDQPDAHLEGELRCAQSEDLAPAEPTERTCDTCGAVVVVAAPAGACDGETFMLEPGEILPRQACPTCRGVGHGLAGACIRCRGAGLIGVELSPADVLVALDARGRARLIAVADRQAGDALMRSHVHVRAEALVAA